MASTLHDEVESYNNQRAILKHIRRSGNKFFKEIEEDRICEKDILFTYFNANEEQFRFLDVVCKRPLTLLVFGQTNFAKATVINKLLQQDILPLDGDDTADWRKSRFVFGERNNVGTFHIDQAGRRVLENTTAVSDFPVPESLLQDNRTPNKQSTTEITVNNPCLQAGMSIHCSPQRDSDLGLEDVAQMFLDNLVSVLIFSIEHPSLNGKDIEQLNHLKALDPNVAVYFVKCYRETKETFMESLTESDKHFTAVEKQNTQLSLCEQLTNLGFLSTKVQENGVDEISDDILNTADELKTASKCVLYSDLDEFPSFLKSCLRYYLLCACKTLMNCHIHVLETFILLAFDMTRYANVTPKRIDYAIMKEQELFDALVDIASKKQHDIQQLIHNTIQSLTQRILTDAEMYEFTNVEFLPGTCEIASHKDLEECINQIQELVLTTVNTSVLKEIMKSVEQLRESFVGTVQRCIEHLEEFNQETATEDDKHVLSAFKQVLDSAYQVQLTLRASASFARLLLQKMKHALASLPGHALPHIDIQWRHKTAQDMLNTLSESRLAKNICSQFKYKLRRSHDTFCASMEILQKRHSGCMQKTEVNLLEIQKNYTPRIAKFVLESNSLEDLIMFGMPNFKCEIARGMYGIVWACEQWGEHRNCAVKSMVPVDDKYWNDFALEFYYLRALPHHGRIVSVLGSIINYNYGDGTNPEVLLIMERLQRDLEQGIRLGMTYPARLQVALDVVEGLRFLHSQGLVHRDIKLKNVLLDVNNRAKITDLGFCKSEAMISGTVVGSPIHMAPELLNGKYDNTVDVYAFGILLWFLCAGRIEKPDAFDKCVGKEHLFKLVRRGARPERLPHFKKDCWELMAACWDSDPGNRPLLGDVQPKLEKMLALSLQGKGTPSPSNSTGSDLFEEYVKVDMLTYDSD